MLVDSCVGRFTSILSFISLSIASLNEITSSNLSCSLRGLISSSSSSEIGFQVCLCFVLQIPYQYSNKEFLGTPSQDGTRKDLTYASKQHKNAYISNDIFPNHGIQIKVYCDLQYTTHYQIPFEHGKYYLGPKRCHFWYMSDCYRSFS